MDFLVSLGLDRTPGGLAAQLDAYAAAALREFGGVLELVLSYLHETLDDGAAPDGGEGGGGAPQAEPEAAEPAPEPAAPEADAARVGE